LPLKKMTGAELHDGVALSKPASVPGHCKLNEFPGTASALPLYAGYVESN
jgi:hypothetical protein